MATANFKSVSTRPSLGRIEIHLNMDSQGNAQAQLSADRPQTLDAFAARFRAPLNAL